jgi:hypothetical protein
MPRAGVSKTLWSVEDIADPVGAAAPKPAKHGPYKPRAAAQFKLTHYRSITSSAATRKIWRHLER